MPFNLNFQNHDGTSVSISIQNGECIFVLGANGTGKSSLMHRFYNSTHNTARRISAHRQTWFTSSSLTLSPEQKRQTENQIHNTDTGAQARWKDDYAAQRANIAIYDIIDAENVRARSIANAVDSDNIDLARCLSKKDAPIKVINELLRLSNIPIEISVKKNEQVVASKNGSAAYSVAELSDGERNALLIAANVLTVPENTLLLIDEPERHLHRSIISPLLTLLFSKRQDCAFVVSTHDVMLPLDNPTARTVLIRGCTYNGQSVQSWDADIVPPESAIDESLKKDILGSRRKLLFVEGDSVLSLDKPLYSLLFPNVSVIAKHGCRDVERAVLGIRGAANLHWVRAFGIIDNDRRTTEEIEQLKSSGIYGLAVYAVESIYYHPEIQRRIVIRHTGVTGEDHAILLENAKKAALSSIGPHIKRLASRAAEKAIRANLGKLFPTQSEIAAKNPIHIDLDVAECVEAEEMYIQNLVSSEDLETIICRYAVRETPMLTEISRKLGFQSRSQYEDAVRKLLMDDSEALGFTRSLFEDLGNAISDA